jgi:cytoskeletal protein CcmA (bactofilin family)
MWGKKPETQSQGKSQQPQPQQQPKPEVYEPQAANPPKPAPAIVEEKKMSTDAMRPAAPAGSTARLGASLHVKGEISGHEDLLIDGSVEGLIQLEDRKLTVGASAKVSADVVSREVVVYGAVKGNLRARDRIEIKKDGSVVGDLTTARIMIEDGAYFKGSIEIDKTGDNASDHDLDKPAYTRAVTAGTAKTNS